ncbi:histidinol-phosphate aminotransferase family protein [bacterium]|nr:histidinol-phosphate aminotransferase family protein [bacterium]
MIDLSHSHLRSVPVIIKKIVTEDAFNYPDPRIKNVLITKLSQLHDIPMENICLGNGSSELIDVITSLFGHNSVIFTPTFFLYEYYSKKYNRKPTIIPWIWETTYLEGSLNLTESSLIWICNPNNPTGHWLEPHVIYHLAEKNEGIIAVDESFSAFKEPEMKSISASEAFNNIISLRSFSKEFGIPGIRLGYCIGHQDIISRLNERIEPYSVNSLALLYGIYAIEYYVEYRKIIEEYINRRDIMYEILLKAGYYPIKSYGNFISIEFPSTKCMNTIKTALFKKGIKVVDFSDWEFTSNNESYIRVAIPNEKDQNYVVSSLLEVRKKYEILF